MSINFGIVPVRCTFTLSTDARFYAVLRTRDNSNFPVSSGMKINWMDSSDALLSTFTATISTSTATFNETKATCAALLATNPEQGRLFYDDGSGHTDLLLATGDVIDKSS